MNQKEIMSSFLLWFWIIPPFVCLCLVLDNINFLPEMKYTGIYFLHIVATIIPVVVTVYHINTMYTFFGPLLGRTGTEVPGDIVIAVFSAISIGVCFTYFVSIINSIFYMLFIMVLLEFSVTVIKKSPS